MNKKKILLLSLASLLLVSCGTKPLTKEEALLRAETMKEKVENDEVAIPSKYVYTQNHSFTDSMKVCEYTKGFKCSWMKIKIITILNKLKPLLNYHHWMRLQNQRFLMDIIYLFKIIN